jgi:transcriptional regulator with XRE-family HTH domain
LASSARTSPESSLVWTGSLIRRLRGKRTQTEFGRLLGVPKNTVWRWEAGAAAPDSSNGRRLSRLARRERFREGLEVAGSLRVVGGPPAVPRGLARSILRSLERTARGLEG